MPQKNLFSGSEGFSDGATIGASDSVIGQGNAVTISLHNPGAHLCVMRMRPIKSVNNADPQWSHVGGVVTSDRHRFNLFLGGYEYDVYVLMLGDVAQPARFTVTALSDLTNFGINRQDILEAFSGTSFVGLSIRDDNDFYDTGDLTRLRQATAPLFFHSSDDATENANFAGLWARVGNNAGIDYIKYHVARQQLLLTTAVADYYNTGGQVDPDPDDPPNNGGPIIGVVGQAPPTYTGAPSLLALPGAGLTSDVASSGDITLQWATPVGFDINLDLVELTFNGIIVYRGNNRTQFVVTGRPKTTHTASARIVRDDGSHGVLQSIVVDSSTVTNDPDPMPTDGTPTTQAFTRIDAATLDYVDGDQVTGQTMTVNTGVAGYTGDGALVVNNVAQTVAADGARARFTNFPGIPGEKPVWFRVNALNARDQFGVQAIETGGVGAAETVGNSWEWVRSPQDAPPYDVSYDIRAMAAGMAFDAIIIAAPGDDTVPTGSEGFIAAS